MIYDSYEAVRENRGSRMTEREFYISIVPEISELIVLLRDVSPEDREEIKREMLNSCKARPQAFRFMEKL